MERTVGDDKVPQETGCKELEVTVSEEGQGDEG